MLSVPGTRIRGEQEYVPDSVCLLLMHMCLVTGGDDVWYRQIESHISCISNVRSISGTCRRIVEPTIIVEEVAYIVAHSMKTSECKCRDRQVKRTSIFVDNSVLVRN